MPVAMERIRNACFFGFAAQLFQRRTCATDVEINSQMAFRPKALGYFEQVKDSLVAFDSSGEQNAKGRMLDGIADTGEGLSPIGGQEGNYGSVLPAGHLLNL